MLVTRLCYVVRDPWLEIIVRATSLGSIVVGCSNSEGELQIGLS